NAALLAPRDRRGAVADQPPARPEQRPAPPEAPAADRVHDEVEGLLAARYAANLLGEVGARVVDRVIDPEAPNRVVLGWRRGPVDLIGPGQLRDLRRGDAHATGGRVDQDPLALPERAVADQARVRGGVHHRQRGALLEAPAVRERHRVVGPAYDELRVPAEAATGEHALAARGPLDPVPPH